jgi:hypothetical protein
MACIVMTHGRRDCIEKTIQSARRNAHLDKFMYRLIIDDSADPEFTDWLSALYNPYFKIYPTEEPLGFCGSIQRAWDILEVMDFDYVFHLEDDFVIKELIGLGVMIDILESHEDIAQVALLRQAWNKPEKEAGGVIQLYPNDFHEVSENGMTWTEHKRFFTTNPSLYSRHITTYDYPQSEFCEGKFSIQLRDLGYKFAYLGRKNQAPKVEHIGGRTGKHWKWV